MTLAPDFTRHRHDTRRRTLQVTEVTRLSPAMLRLRLAGPSLSDFVSLSPGDHVKLFVPDGAGGTTMRDYTPRRFDAAAGWLEIDFALHEAGPATLWALGVKPGDLAEIGGPRGSLVIGGPLSGWLLIGDETALPSIARRTEEIAGKLPVTTLVAVAGPEEEQTLQARALWVHRSDPTEAAGLLAALAGIGIPPRTFVWIAAEAGVARRLRDTVLDRGVAPEWVRAAGYWQAGTADAAIKDL